LLGFDSGKQWQSNLGGDENWKNRPTHENGERSMLIDIKNHYLYLEIHKNLVDSYLDFCQTLDRVIRRR
jgi:hypothetical protein